MTDARQAEIAKIIEQARKDGAEAGKAAATWYFDTGRCSTEDYRKALKGIEDIDPEMMDTLPSSPLSGEYADGPTPHTLARQYGIDEETESEDLNNVCDAYQEAYEQAAQDEVERAARYQLAG
jgi:hypothetical protein